MAHLLHVDSSIRGDSSVSRKLSARAAAAWRAAHPGGTVTYRDLGRDPLPHLDAAGGLARILPRDQHTAAHAESWALSEELVSEIREADTIVLGLPLYNFGAPSSVKAWVDHLIAPGCPSTPRPTPACSADATSSCSPAEAAATPKARHAKAGTTPSRGYRTPSCPRAWSRASSPPSSHSPR